MNVAVIGGIALDQHFNIGRKSKDYDIIGSYDDVRDFIQDAFGSEPHAFYPIDSGKKYIARSNNAIYEAEIAWPGSTAEKLLDIIANDPMTREGYDGCLLPSLDVLYMLKMSHRYLKNSPHFSKTMEDIWEMRHRGAKIREEHLEFFKLREAETYAYSHPKLNQNKSEFFSGDGVKYVYDHDS